jgi:erythromycin esterase-like protein
MASLGSSLELLGFGEAMHGSEDILSLRNRLFSHLVKRHGFSAIALESSFPRARLVNQYISGCGPASYEDIQDAGFSHGFGRMQANRDLVEWMKKYNADSSHAVKLQFYGFDSPTEMTGTDSPRQLLHFVLDYLDFMESSRHSELQDQSAAHRKGEGVRRERIEALLGRDGDWQSFEAMMDPDRSVGRSPDACALRVETEDLMAELLSRRPEAVKAGGIGRYREAVQHLALARQLLSYHAAMARKSEKRTSELLGIRDAMMADNLAYAVSQERGRGRVLAFAHNSHLQMGRAEWQLGRELNVWWPAGSHLHEIFAAGYAVIGTAVGFSAAQGIGEPENGSLEAHLAAATGQSKLLSTCKGRELAGGPAAAALKTRSKSQKNSTYFPLTAKSLTDFDWLAFLDRCG